MKKTTSASKADLLLALHTADDLLILPNVWNPLGARVLQSRGYPAVATASAAISSSLGYVDGERIKRSTLIDMVGRIARSVDLPVTADIERGYGATVAEMEETIQAVIDCGVVGVNIEDSLEEGQPLRLVEEQCERISAARRVADQSNIHLVINARIDSFLVPETASKDVTADAVARANAYIDAGADCVYPIGGLDDTTIRTLRERITSPINILALPGGASMSFLREAGINRVSFGPFILRSCLKKFIGIVDVLQARGSYSCFDDKLSLEEAAEFLIDDHEQVSD